MNSTNEQPDALERLVDRTLRAQPLVKAPRSLEARVLDAIARRSAKTGWRGGFAQWPVTARAAFGGLSVAAMWALTRLSDAPVEQVLGASAERAHLARSVSTSLADVGIYLLDSIPSYWLYAGVLGCVAAYVTLFGLGAAAYKALYK